MMNLSFRHARAALAAIALLTVTCRDVHVTAVDVARIEISPAAPSVEVAQTTPLVARVLSGGGRELQGRTVQWQTRDPSIATVSASGVVSGVAAGTTHIRAATEGVADSVSITVTPRPQIQLAADDVQFSAVQGTASPAAQTVAVSNGGGGSLTGLSAAVSYDAGQPSGWLTATLAATTAPTMLTLAAATGSLPVGSHTARVLVAAPTAANAPVTITVTFSIGHVPPSAPTSLTAGIVSSSQVHLAWAAAGGTVEEYRIERRTGATGAWTQLASISAGKSGWSRRMSSGWPNRIVL